MASRKKGPKGEEFKQEDILQAVILADSFNVRFAPITKLKPRALLPLANIPLLEYTLEFLCSAGIQEVIVFCCVHASQIKAHIANSKWGSSSSPMELLTIVSEDCRSAGDAIRDIDAKSLISNDFVLVHGDIVSNVKLKPIIELHKARRLKDKSVIMTMLYKKAPPGHRIRCKEDEVVLAVNPENKRVLSYQKLGNLKKFDFPLEMFSENKSVQLRYDLMDCHISICSPHVPPLYTDNFDYSTRDDFVRGILVNEEVLGNKIHIHVVETEYAARVSNLQMYDSISKDVLNRWVYPMVPDNAVTEKDDDKYSYGRHNIYIHNQVTLARDCELQENVMIGKDTCIGAKTVICDSVIGQNCKIGQHVKLEGAYIWDGTTIEDNCMLTTCLVDTGVLVKKHVQVLAGCVLGADVVVGPDVTLNPGTMLSAQPQVNEWAEDGEEPESPVLDTGIVGEEGLGYVYHPPAESDEETDEITRDIWGLRLESEEEDSLSLFSESSEDNGEARDSPPPDEPKLFYNEVISTLERALVEHIGTDNMILEINSAKHGYYIQIKEVNHLLTKAIMELPLKENDQLEPTQYLTRIKINFKTFLPILRNYIRNEESQMDCLISLEEFSTVQVTGQRVLVRVIQFLYEADLLSEEVIIKWYKDLSEDDTKQKEIKKQILPFIKWLQEAEEESDAESDEDEEDDD